MSAFWNFIKTVQSIFVPLKDTLDWQRIAFQPMLYMALWIAAIVIIVKGDFATIPPDLADATTTHGPTFWMWIGLSLACPPLGLVSLWMVRAPSGVWKYRGLWTRLGADIGQGVALLIYVVQRFHIGDWHVYPMAATLAAGVFVAHLVLRDVERLWAVEKLANSLHRIKSSDVL